MEQYFWFLFHFLCWFHLLFNFSASSGFDSELIISDKLALLDLKHRITHDPFQIMSSWNESMHFCNWTGVTCSPTSGRVIMLNLKSRNLVGSIPPSIGNLSSLTTVYLQNNGFRGKVPQEIGCLQHLHVLNVTYNQFGGSVPTNLSGCQDLRTLSASYNEFTGQIPPQICSLSKLKKLGLGRNNLTGIIPACIGNLSSLQFLILSLNNVQGSLPKELGQISGLQLLQLYGNHLSGKIPSSIYNISSIYFFSVAQNQLHGKLPSDVGLTLPNLQVFAGGLNHFTGNIPESLANASSLQIVDFGHNNLTGTVPRTFGSLQSLDGLSFASNNLGDGKIGDLNFLTSLTNCTSLQWLGLDHNRFGGELPNAIGNLSTQLQEFAIGSNLIHGNIPFVIGNLVNLEILALDANYLHGSVPDTIGRLWNLEVLYLNYNRFSGLIPSSLGNLTKLLEFFMEENKFEGSIPSNLGNCQKLQILILSGNKLNGTIPTQVIGLSSLSISLAMSNNFLTGSLPLEVGNLKNLAKLDVSKNKLSGEIPDSLASCTSLESLYLASNSFVGTIPRSLKNLRGLEELDISYNNFSGQIPEFLSKLSLRYLNLSYNKFNGDVPREGIFANVTSISLVGNDKLCGGAPKLLLPACLKKVSKKIINQKVLISITVVVPLAILLPISFVLYYKLKSSSRQHTTSSVEQHLHLSYFEIAKSTDNFSKEKLIGLGSFCYVYKGTLFGDEKIVAIKVLQVQQQGAFKSFIDECNALRSIRHRNTLKIITVCSSIDHEGNDFKCLVFEFMSNGSLDKWLHPTSDEHPQIKKLTLIQRLNIAMDIASAFDYLHNHCETPIVHCDLKPSNVMFDEDMTTHVGDFGLARFLFEATSDHLSQSQTPSIGLRGSVGYIPPEYTRGQISVLGDIYSHGILLLEMFTGKRPTDDMFKDDLNIHNFVLMAFPDHVMDVVDPSLLSEEENEDYREEEAMIRNAESGINYKGKLEACLVSVLTIGLMCSTASPTERMAIKDVLNNLKAIRDSFLKSKVSNKRRTR